MKVFLFIIISLPLLLVIAKIAFFPDKVETMKSSPTPTKSATISKAAQPKHMKIISTAFEHQQSIPAKYTCNGDNVNPPLQFSEVSEKAKSLVLIVDDPDATAPGGWVHWVIFNMEPRTLGIEENTKPTTGVEGTTSFGKPGYGGPCPPSGTHHYFFKLYALDTALNLTAVADKKAVEEAMQGHIVDQAELVGLYSK